LNESANPVPRHQAPTHPEIQELQIIMRRIEDRLDDIVDQVPARQRCLVPNALLNVAIERILAAEGAAISAGILLRLADLILSGAQPSGHGAYRLSGHDA
jgi:hypothetical protein